MNRKFDINNVYYGTKEDFSKSKVPCLVYNTGKTLIDLNTKEKYIYIKSCNNCFNVTKKGRKYFLIGNEKVYNLVSITSIIDKEIVINSIEDLIKVDNNIIKTLDKRGYKFKYNKIENTLAIIKPDGMCHANEIVNRILESGLKIKKYDVRMLNQDILREHYSHLIDKPFYQELEDYMLEGNVIIMELEGYNAIEKLRKLMGPTDSKKAPQGTIRGDFGTDIMHNVIHGSDSKENAEIEINRFFNQKVKTLKKEN